MWRVRMKTSRAFQTPTTNWSKRTWWPPMSSIVHCQRLERCSLNIYWAPALRHNDPFQTAQATSSPPKLNWLWDAWFAYSWHYHWSTIVHDTQKAEFQKTHKCNKCLSCQRATGSGCNQACALRSIRQKPGALPFCPNQTWIHFVFQSITVFFRNDACTLCTVLWLPRLQRSSSPRAWRAHIEVLRLRATEGEIHFVPFNTPAQSKNLINSDPLPGAPKSVVTDTSSSGPRLTLSPIRPSRLDTHWTRIGNPSLPNCTQYRLLTNNHRRNS